MNSTASRLALAAGALLVLTAFVHPSRAARGDPAQCALPAAVAPDTSRGLGPLGGPSLGVVTARDLGGAVEPTPQQAPVYGRRNGPAPLERMLRDWRSPQGGPNTPPVDPPKPVLRAPGRTPDNSPAAPGS